MKRIVLAFVWLAAVFCSIELMLRLVGPFMPNPVGAVITEEFYRSAQSAMRFANGSTVIFREEDLRHPHNIFACGDSMTYGVMVRSGHDWPSIVGEDMGKSVLNLGLPSQGPVAYNMVLKLALKKTRLRRRSFCILFSPMTRWKIGERSTSGRIRSIPGREIIRKISKCR